MINVVIMHQVQTQARGKFSVKASWDCMSKIYWKIVLYQIVEILSLPDHQNLHY